MSAVELPWMDRRVTVVCHVAEVYRTAQERAKPLY